MDRRGAAGIAALAVIAGAALSLLRVRGLGAFDALWAEDGTIFLTDALASASPATWFHAYAGYMHLVPRFLGTLAGALPLPMAPVVMAAGAALVTAGVAIVTYRAAEEHIPAAGVRLALALVVLLLPPAGLEVANSAANIHWYLLYAAGWVALWRPATRAGVAVGSAVLLLTAASDPFGALVAPVLGIRLLRQPADRTAWVLAGALAAGVALQAGVMVSSAGSRDVDPFGTSPVALARWYGFHVIAVAAFGITLRELLVGHVGAAVTSVLALGWLGLLLAPAVRAARERPFAPFALAALHLGFFVVPVALAGLSTSRYTVAPILYLYALIGFGLAHAARGLGKPVGVMALAGLATMSILDFAPANRRTEGPRWSEELAKGSAACRAPGLGAAQLVIPPLPAPRRDDPSQQTPLWSVSVPCGKLAPGGAQ